MNGQCLMCDSATLHCYGILYGKKVCGSCYTRGERLLLWLESAGVLSQEHEACEPPASRPGHWVSDTDTDTDTDEDMPSFTATAQVPFSV